MDKTQVLFEIINIQVLPFWFYHCGEGNGITLQTHSEGAMYKGRVELKKLYISSWLSSKNWTKIQNKL